MVTSLTGALTHRRLAFSDVIRTNEMQVWFTAEHVVDAPVVEAE